MASSLAELFLPAIIGERVPAMLARCDYVTEEIVAFWKPRETQASRDVDFALTYVLQHADRAQEQQKVIDALVFKCDLLWAMLDGLEQAYGDGGHFPSGAFDPKQP